MTIEPKQTTRSLKSEETVSRYMQKTVLTMQPHQNLYDACCLMRNTRMGCVVIVDNNVRPIGMISESTIVKQMASGRDIKTPVSKVMTQPVITIGPDETVANALELMRRYHIRRLPLVKDKRLLGLVTQTDLLEASLRLINSLHKIHGHLSRLAHHDELTGLHSRRYFNNALAEELQRTRSFGGLLSLLLIDIDHFKAINDQYGHNAGDKVLQSVAALMRTQARPIDILARYGGDELAVLLPGIGTRATYLFADALRETIAQSSIAVNQDTIKVTISGGICKWNRELDSITALVHEADKYLYEAKRSGRNRIMVAD